MKTAAVFVHGLWLTGAEFTLLRRRLAASHGFECHSFSYRPSGGSMGTVIEKLARFVSRIDAERVHFVGHSLGGIVLHRYFEAASVCEPGRVVFLGSPTVGSSTAERWPPAGALARHRPLVRRARRACGRVSGAAGASWDYRGHASDGPWPVLRTLRRGMRRHHRRQRNQTTRPYRARDIAGESHGNAGLAAVAGQVGAIPGPGSIRDNPGGPGHGGYTGVMHRPHAADTLG